VQLLAVHETTHGDDEAACATVVTGGDAEVAKMVTLAVPLVKPDTRTRNCCPDAHVATPSVAPVMADSRTPARVVTVTGDHDCVRSKGPFVVHSAVNVPENETGMVTEIPKLD
jgi:hypothetical protein